jgi:hypothetical protein
LLLQNFPIVGSSGFIFFVEEDKNFSVGIIENNSYRKIELPACWKRDFLKLKNFLLKNP